MATMAFSVAAKLQFSQVTRLEGASKSELAESVESIPLLQNSRLIERRQSFSAVQCSTASPKKNSRDVKAAAQPIAAATAIAPTPSAIKYELPTWAKFELGHYPVFWETATGRPPAAGESLTIWFNPAASTLTPNEEFGIAFNGGFNSPIMCAGDPRIMTKKERGPQCENFYTIRINVPVHATHIEFSFTDGGSWTDAYYLQLEIPAKWRNQPPTFFNQGLTKELQTEGACETAIYPDAPYIQDRCLMPSSMVHAQSAVCELPIVPGCTDPESPFYDPLATHDDGSCPLEPEL